MSRFLECQDVTGPWQSWNYQTLDFVMKKNYLFPFSQQIMQQYNAHEKGHCHADIVNRNVW